MRNRKQPFGYRMVLGEVVVQPEEAATVRDIFCRYIAGESLVDLTKTLCQQDVPYDEKRTWNKNMVARILQDRRYTGERAYPPIIEPEQMSIVDEKRSVKARPAKKTEVQKVLRRLCGTSPSEHVEKNVTALLNSLIRSPTLIICPERYPVPPDSKTRKKLSGVLGQQPIDEEAAKPLILQLAAEQYAAIGNEEYETVRLQRLFCSAEESEAMDAELLRNTVSKVIVTNQRIQLKLKNGQIIERGELQ